MGLFFFFLNEYLKIHQNLSVTKCISSGLYFSTYIRAKDSKYIAWCSTGKNWFALKCFQGKESAGCPLVLKQGKTIVSFCFNLEHSVLPL